MIISVPRSRCCDVFLRRSSTTSESGAKAAGSINRNGVFCLCGVFFIVACIWPRVVVSQVLSESERLGSLTSPVLDCLADEKWANYLGLVLDFIDSNAPLGDILSASEEISKQWIYDHIDGNENLFQAVHLTLLNIMDEQMSGQPGVQVGSGCMYGTVTALYFFAYGNTLSDEVDTAILMLSQITRILRMNDLDFLEDSRWPVTSWHVLRNLDFLRNGKRFQLFPENLAKPGGILPLGLPSVWPPVAPCRFGRDDSASLAVWWTAMHLGPFQDVIAVLSKFWNHPVNIHHNSLAEYHCEFLPQFCSTDDDLKQVLRRDSLYLRTTEKQWQGALDLHADFDNVTKHFQRIFAAKFRSMGIKLLMCAHPLFWCRLYEGLGIPFLGVYENVHTLFLEEADADVWTGQLRELFSPEKASLLVAWTPFHAFQAEWATRMKLPYARGLALSWPQGIWRGEFNSTVLVSPCPSWQPTQLLRHLFNLAKSVAKLSFDLLRWPEDIFCGSRCKPRDFASFRSVILWPYDIGNSKFAELYALAIPIFAPEQLWRWSMRASSTFAQGNRNASLWQGKDVEFKMSNCSVESSSACVHFDFAHWMWQNPWQLGSDMPFAPYSPDRYNLRPKSAAFWSELSEYALRPQITFFRSFAELFGILQATDSGTLRAKSDAMSAWQRVEAQAVVNFWREAVLSLLETGSSGSMERLRKFRA